MKRSLITCLLMIYAISSFAQKETESAEPTFGVELERKVAFAVIENDSYKDVVVELKAADLVSILDGVKVTVKNAKTGKKIYKKRFSKSYLYGFSNGTIQVGKGNTLTQVVITKSTYNGKWIMEIKEKGIY